MGHTKDEVVFLPPQPKNLSKSELTNNPTHSTIIVARAQLIKNTNEEEEPHGHHTRAASIPCAVDSGD